MSIWPNFNHTFWVTLAKRSSFWCPSCTRVPNAWSFVPFTLTFDKLLLIIYPNIFSYSISTFHSRTTMRLHLARVSPRLITCWDCSLAAPPTWAPSASCWWVLSKELYKEVSQSRARKQKCDVMAGPYWPSSPWPLNQHCDVITRPTASAASFVFPLWSTCTRGLGSVIVHIGHLATISCSLCLLLSSISDMQSRTWARLSSL